MSSNPIHYSSNSPDVGVYDCEIHLKFRLIEDREALGDREQLLENLLEAFTCGADECMQPLQVYVAAEEIAEVDATPEMRRQLIRLRNSRDLS